MNAPITADLIAADGHLFMLAAIAAQFVVIAAAIAAVQVTRAARDRLGEERRLHEEAREDYQVTGGPGGCPTAVRMRRLPNATWVEVRGGPLTDELFAAIQAARGVPCGRHKRWSERYVFDALDADQADAITRLLADAGVSFTVEVTWAGGPAAATA